MKTFRAWAPSNIALVKYMGKENAELNLPANPSVSLTLNGLRTYAELEELPTAEKSEWRAEMPSRACEKAKVPGLKAAGMERILKQLGRVEKLLPRALAPFGLMAREDRPAFALRTANTFPSASGIASSASSFAAVTLAGAQALCTEPEKFAALWEGEPQLRRALATIARQGSGSACRSLEGEWVSWKGEHSGRITSDLPALHHFVIVIAAQEKSISSSEAHLRVKTSPLWNGRPERARERVARLETAIARGDLRQASHIAWAEMWEMHSLFHTSSESFSYFAPGTTEVLGWLAPFIQAPSSALDAVIVTLDAGPNVHLTVDARKQSDWHQRLIARFPKFSVLQDSPGQGAVLQ